MDAIQGDIDSFYARYAKKEGITIAEAKKRANKLDMEAYERKAKKYVREKDFSKTADEEMRLYNLTMKVNRLELLKANIGMDLVAGYDELDKYMAEILEGRAIEEVTRQAGILGKTVLNNAQKAHAIVNASFHNATFSDRIWMHQDLLKSELSKLLQIGLIQGKNPRTLAAELRKRFDVSENNAERLMRTELARVQAEAQKQSFIRNGFKQYTFITNSGCCGICAGLNGKHFDVDKMMPGENAPPMHPNCRCSVAAYEDSEDYNAWLDFLDQGGTTEEYERMKTGKTVAKFTENGTMREATDKGKVDVHTVGKIDRNIYKCITDDIVTDEVIITDNQIQHILDRHSDAYEKVIDYLETAISNPDFIIEDKHADTGLVIKQIDLTNKQHTQIVLRICTSKDEPGYKNSVISCWEISERRLQNYLRNKKILYRRE